MALSREDVLATARRSPAAASARDREAWVGLFTHDARVEDPVGSQPHVGRAAIRQFFDTFIAPREVTFHPDADIVLGATVIRDGVLEAALGSVTLRVPIYIRYDIREEDDGDPRIAALSAFWELPAMVGQFLRGGLGALPAGVGLARLLLSNQGLTGTLGFLDGFRGGGPQRRRKFGEFLTDARVGDEVAVRRRLGKGARITLGDDTAMGAAELLSNLTGARPRKLIAAGRHVVAGIERGDRRDIVIADMAGKAFAVNAIRYFPGAADTGAV
jgi:hypothetical protein